MADCIKCRSYTKFNGGLCTKCYHEKNHSSDEIDFFDEFNESKSEGLTNKERTYRYNMIKGRIAETLIQELFLSLGFNVFKYGMENTIPGIMELLKGIKSEVAREIKLMPDFVIQDNRNHAVYFVEVKFRANGSFKYVDLGKDYPYSNAYLIVVSKKHIKCLTVEDLKDGKEITPSCRNYLGSRKEFDLDKDIIVEFCDFAVQFFESVETPLKR